MAQLGRHFNGRKLRELRQHLAMSTQEFADKVGWNVLTLKNKECASVAVGTIDRLAKAASVLGLTYDDLMGKIAVTSDDLRNTDPPQSTKDKSAVSKRLDRIEAILETLTADKSAERIEKLLLTLLSQNPAPARAQSTRARHGS